MPSERQRQGLNNYITLFNQLEQGIDCLPDCVAPTISFSDPFVELQGRDALAEYLVHFATKVSEPRFEQVYSGWDGDVCLLRWNFSGGLKTPADWCFAGVSELHFDQQGRVTKHVDHWDSGRYFYRRLPLIGWLIRWVESRLHK